MTQASETRTIDGEVQEQAELVRRGDRLEEFRWRWREQPHSVAMVGCGGNYWYVWPMLRVLFQEASFVSFVDPDRIQPGNERRQWRARNNGELKVDAALDLWGAEVASRARPMGIAEVPARDLCSRGTAGLVVVCQPDNDQARLQTAEKCEEVMGLCQREYVAMIASGTMRDQGQAYWGVMDREGWIYDWREQHLGRDVFNDPTDGGCGQQALDNHLTASVTGLALYDLLCGDRQVREFWWSRRWGGVLSTVKTMADFRALGEEEEV